MLTITVQGTLEDRLKRAAASANTEPQAIAERVLDEHLPNLNQATLDLLFKWETDEATTDPEELARRQSEGEQFMRTLAENRSAGEGADARKTLAINMVIVLDSTPLGLLLHQPGFALADECRAWLQRHLALNARVCVPAIIAYEIRRELLRLRNARSLNLLDAFIAAAAQRYIELTDAQLRHAAELWADLRRAGRPTADPLALDIDVILAAQALSLKLAPADFVVATSNVGHLSLLVPARAWQQI